LAKFTPLEKFTIPEKFAILKFAIPVDVKSPTRPEE
jgi:hypothetical protein